MTEFRIPLVFDQGNVKGSRTKLGPVSLVMADSAWLPSKQFEVMHVHTNRRIGKLDMHQCLMLSIEEAFQKSPE